MRITEEDYKKEPVKGYEEYSIDTKGVVYSKKNRPLKPSLNWNGYSIVNFLKDGARKGFSVHTLVAKQFIHNDDPEKCQVNHKDGVKTNNCVQNLEWVSPLENARHRGDVLGRDTRGSKNGNAKPIRAKSKKTGAVVYELGSLADAIRLTEKEYNVSYYAAETGICRVLYGYRKSYKGLIWEYI